MAELLTPPSAEEVRAAHTIVGQYVQPTPLIEYPLLSRRLGCEAWIKLENTTPIGAFKVRGGVFHLSQLSDEERAQGFVTATRGNHGQSVAYACRIYGSKCTIFVPEGNNPDKNEAMSSFGADVRIKGKDFDEAVENSREFAAETGARLLHPADRDLIVGVATMALEILDQCPHTLDAVFLPVGVGSAIIGVASVMKELSPSTKIIGVQAEGAPAMYRSFKSGKPESSDSVNTIADGLAVRSAVWATASLLQDLVDDMLLVSEDEIREGIRWYAETAHHLAEGGAATALAGLNKVKAQYAGKRVALPITGGNIDLATLKSVICC